ncbi:MAG: PIN domain-containing protein [Dehalococcoidia bacterium]|nr:PIN domain-containing protein [Dehalococcoidia bacterium]
MARADALDRALGGAERVLLDSSALIAYHTSRERAHSLATHLLQRIEDDDDPLHAYFSVVSAAELLIRPHRAGPAEFAFMYTFLSSFPNLTALSMDLGVAVRAAEIRAVAGLRLPDAIIVASGLQADCQVIVSNDEKWGRKLGPLFPQVTWVYLGDYV